MIDERMTVPQENVAEEESKTDIKAIVIQYLLYWPWIVICVIIALIAAWIYLKRTAPVYQTSASVLIKDNTNNGTMPSGQNGSLLNNMQDMGLFSMASTFDNEVQILSSRTLVKHVVEDLDLYVSQARKGTFRSTDLYGASPIKIWTTPEEATKMGFMKMDVKLAANGSLDVEATVKKNKQEYTYNKHFAKMPALLSTRFGVVSITRVDSIPLTEDMDISASIADPAQVSLAYTGNLTVSPTSKTTTIALLDYNDVNPLRATVFLNKLIERYNLEANLDKNQVAQKTADFINNRILLISKELGSTENNMAGFKQRAGLTDLTADAQMALSGRAEYENRLAQCETQAHLVSYVKDAIRSIGNRNDVYPVVGLGMPDGNGNVSDQGLGTLINTYNAQVIERNRLAKNADESSSVISNMDVQLKALRKNIHETLNSIDTGVRMAQRKLRAEAAKYQGQISNAPQDEKQFLNISRQRDFQSKLYLILLQKREENAITLAATANNGRIIEEPMTSPNPVSPKNKMIYLIALVLGVAVPVGIIYLRNMLSFKVENRGDIERITNLPIVGDVPFDKEAKKERKIVVHENSNELFDEIFRSVRTNIDFMRGDKKVIMFTSSIQGEGKSTLAGNVAASYAFLGKKVVIVGLDIRKPGLNKVFKISRHKPGISQFLAQPDTTDLLSLIQPSGISDNLDVLPGGIVPPNPTELVARKSLEKAMDILKQKYDLIILDTAPVGIVTDTLIVSRVADLCIYVCRVNYAPKAAFTLVNDLEKEKKLPQMAVLVNAVDMDSRSSGYYYGYGKYGHYGKYGYGKKYGYGYSYEQEHEQKNKTFFQRLFGKK